MSRLFGCMCNEPERLKCALYAARDALCADEAPDGWGLAFFQGGEVLLQRNPKPASHVDFYAALRDLKSDYLVGHVRDPGTQAKLENTQPFRFRHWVFAHRGSLEKFEAIQAGLLEAIPDFLRRNIRGQADSELVFHLFLAFLHDEGRLDDLDITVAAAQAALSNTVKLIEKLLQAAGVGAPRAFSLIVTNGRLMLAARRGAPMWWQRQNSLLDCPVCREAGRETRRVGHEHLRSILIVSEPKKLGPARWEEVPDGSIIAVTRDLETTLM